MSLGLKSSPEGPATPMRKALASEVFRARLRSVRPGHLEDRIAQAFRQRWGRDGDSQNQRNEATGHTAHTDAHTALTHMSTRTALLVRQPLSAAGQRRRDHKAEDGRPRALCSLTRSACTETPLQPSLQGSFKSTPVLGPQKQTRKKQ